MRTKRAKAKGRRREPKRRQAIPAGRVQDLLLELAYRLHATRPVASLPRPTASVA
jgi:hypothetical protein